MKRLILIALALTMVLSMAACGCKHTAGELQLISVDSAALTAKWELPCTQCGKVMETKETPTGVSPTGSTLPLSPQDWFACLSTNIRTYDSTGSLMPAAAESQDNALLYTVVSMSGFRSVLSFFDADSNVVTLEQAAQTGLAHRIRLEAQFENETALEFYTLLLMIVMTNNSSWDTEGINALCKQIMDGQTVTDNGYSYTMEIQSVESHTVVVHIVAE